MLRGFLDLPVWQHRRSAVLELGHEFGPCQRLVWITLGNLNELVPPRATVQHDLHDIWTRRIPVDFVLIWMRQAYTLHPRRGVGVLHAGIRELRQAHLAVQERRSQAVLHAKLPRQTRLRLVVDEKIAHARADVANNLTDVVGLQVVHMHQVEHSINGAGCLAAGRVRFYTDSRRDDLIRRTKILYNGLGHELPFTHEDVEEAKTAVENMRICRESPLRQ